MKESPPKFLLKLFKSFCDPELHTSMEGDLLELYRERVHKSGKTKANLKFLRDILQLVRPEIINAFGNRQTSLNQVSRMGNMYKHNLIIAFRSLKKHSFYSAINICGLTIGMLAFGMIMVYVNDEISYDQFHTKSSRIYRIWDTMSTRQVAVTPYKWARYIKDEFPEIEQYTTAQQLDIVVKRDVALFNENKAFAVDSTFMEVFDFPVIDGDRNNLLNGTNQVVITPAMASKYFGENDPIGKTLEINLYGKEDPFIVSGIVDCPSNSHLQFDFLIPYNLVEKNSINPDWYDHWYIHFVYTYVVLKDELSVQAVEDRFEDFLFKHGGENLRSKYTPGLEPLEDIYLKSQLEFDLPPNGNIDYIRILTLVAVIILVIASINYVNLSTAQSMRRAREVSIRKVFGSGRPSLIFQFITESIMISFCAMVLAILVFVFLLSEYNSFAEKTFKVFQLLNVVNLSMAFALALVIGVFGGLYPAIIISSYKPIKVLYSKATTSIKSAIARKVLTVVQFATALLLLIGTGVIYKQVDYMRNKDLGFDKEQVVFINDAGQVSSNMNEVRKFRQVMSELNNVVAVSASSNPPGGQYWTTRYIPEHWNGEEENISLATIFADYDFLKTYGIEVIEGRDFDLTILTDSTRGFLINEAAKDLFTQYHPSWGENPVGKSIEWIFGPKRGKVVGVFKDFHFESLHHKINPLIIQVKPDNFTSIQLRIRTDEINTTLTSIQKEWAGLFPNVPFDYMFVDQAFEAHLQADRKLGSLFTIFSALSVVVALIGLFGLSSFLAQERAREICIRKVIGASEDQLAYLLSKSFLSLVVIGNIVGIPLAYYFLNDWLDTFANRISMPYVVFIGAFLVTVLASVFTTGYHVFKTSCSNPVKVLSQQ